MTVRESLRESLPDRGLLAEVALPELFLELYRRRWSGRLELTRGRTRKAFSLQDGAAIASESNLPAERLTGVLEQAGTLTLADRERVDALVAKEKCKEGVALMKLQLIDAKALFLALREQLRHRAIDAFGWIDGQFELAPSDERAEDVRPFRTDPYRLVQEGLRTHWSVDRLLAGLQPRMELYPSPGKELPKALRRLELDAATERMIASLNGRQQLGVIVCGAGSTPATVSTFWVLDAVDALAYAREPARDATADAGPIDIEIEIRDGAASDAARRATGPARASEGPTARAEHPEAAAMRTEIAERLENLPNLTYYDLLDVPQNAPLAAIRKAYFKAAKRYHPDAIARLGLSDVRAEAGEVFSKIALANETLSNADKRREYDQSLTGEHQKVDVTTLAQAETFYRKGEILVRMGDFRGALEYLKNAVDLYPEEPVYHSDLGWAYYKKTPPEPGPALEHLRRALELDPSNSVAEFRLGVVERQS